jgi:hypothetical protein
MTDASRRSSFWGSLCRLGFWRLDRGTGVFGGLAFLRTYVALAMAFFCGTVDGLLSSCRCRLTGYVTLNRLRGLGVAFWVGEC